jgi:hypothetical protein
MLMKITGRVRGLFSGNYPENREDEQFQLNNRGEQLVAQGLPELTEIVRLGGSWQVNLTTGVAAATALPTTTAMMSLYNAEPGGGKCYAIDSFGYAEGVTDATQNDTSILLAMCNKAPTTVQTDAGVAIRSLSGRSGYDGKARITSAPTVVNDGWNYHGAEAITPPTVFAGTLWRVTETKVRGLYLIPPTGGFNIAVIKSAAAAASQCFPFVRWHEVQLIYKT